MQSFFSVVLVNSIFCKNAVANNLHISYYDDPGRLECSCKHISDWCTCPPSTYKQKDYHHLLVRNEYIHTVPQLLHSYFRNIIFEWLKFLRKILETIWKNSCDTKNILESKRSKSIQVFCPTVRWNGFSDCDYILRKCYCWRQSIEQ